MVQNLHLLKWNLQIKFEMLYNQKPMAKWNALTTNILSFFGDWLHFLLSARQKASGKRRWNPFTRFGREEFNASLLELVWKPTNWYFLEASSQSRIGFYIFLTFWLQCKATISVSREPEWNSFMQTTFGNEFWSVSAIPWTLGLTNTTQRQFLKLSVELG